MIRIPEGWASLKVKEWSITFDDEINSTSTTTPNFRAYIYRVPMQQIREYPCNASAPNDDWYTGASTTLLGKIESVSEAPAGNPDNRYSFDSPDSFLQAAIDLSGTDNGYLFVRCDLAPILGTSSMTAMMSLQLEGTII